MQATATRYRAVKKMTIGFEDPPKIRTELVWEGLDVVSLSRKYPPSRIMGADDLGHHEIEGGHIRWDHYFEKFVDDEADGVWMACEDPRVRLQEGLSEHEREINAENRRLFPGDFDDDPAFEGYDGPDPEPWD